eukprot:PhM_4_TR17392/c0_g1_i1/m.92790
MSEDIKALGAYGEDPILRVMVDSAGMTRDEFLSSRSKLDNLEVFNQAIPSMAPVAWFGNLVRLQIMNQAVRTIDGLSNMSSLVSLWLTDNYITEIKGLEGCPNLRDLYLNSNQIKSLDGIAHLTKLEVLWFVDNRVTSLAGVEPLTKLRVLWASKNKIDTIGNHLLPLQGLEELNLAGNHIWRLREIPSLERVGALRSLFMSDPVLGDNPVCNVCNYVTFTLFHLRRLRLLDSVLISDDQRQLAEATFFKKRIYYNMRIKTITRNAWGLINKAAQFRQTKIAGVQSSVEALQRCARQLERELDDGSEDGPVAKPAEIEAKLKEVNATTKYKIRTLDRVERYFKQMKSGIHASTTDHVNRLLLELNTGGNVRLEDGQPKDVWCQSCVELVRSRYIQTEFEPYGIKDIRVVRVVRVHNRLLRMRFDERLSQLVDTTEPSYKKAMEYLFCAMPSVDAASVMEDGFVLDAGSDTASVPLTNSVYLADEARLMRERANIPNATELIPGRLVVCKVFLGRCSVERASATPSTEGKVPLAGAPPTISRSDYAAGTSTVYRTRANDNKQRVWYCFEPRVAIPEYIVEYVYCNTHTLPLAMLPEPQEKESTRSNGELKDVLDKLFPMRSEADTGDLKSLSHHFLTYVHSCNTLIPAQEAPLECVDNGPQPKPVARWPSLSADCVKALCGHRTPSSVTNLSAVSLGIKKIEPCLVDFTSLKVLVLSFNELTRVDHLMSLASVEVLDLSHNHLFRVEGIGGMRSLRVLDLSYNTITDGICVVDALKQQAPQISELALRGNPIREYEKVSQIIVATLNGLSIFDGTTLSHGQRVEAETTLCNTMTPSAILKHSGASEDELMTCEEEMTVLLRLAEVRLRGKHIAQLQNLEIMRGAFLIDVSDNLLTSMVEVGHVPSSNKLEELNLSGNFIEHIDGLREEGQFTRLRRLDLGRNRIAHLAGLDGCANLTQLSVEDNRITTLAGLQCLPNLMELYASNNQIDNVKEINYLRENCKLIVLDLAHNALCSDPEYRLYAVFHLKKLKVLDGVPVDAAETQLARETLSGKMTLELLLERTNRQPTDTVKELNLSSCSLKEIALLQQYTALQHLKLDHNILTEISGLACCTNLVSLNLAFNRLNGAGVGKALSVLMKLESMSLEANAIASISSMQLNIPTLKFLNLKNNEIAKVDGLECLPALRELILDKNRIRNFDTTSFINNAFLKELRCEDNMLKSLEGLRPLLNLQRLVLSNNRVTEVAEIEKLDGLERITEISFQGNSIVRKTLYRSMLIYRLPRLVTIDGKEVTVEERERTQQYYAQDYVGSQVPPNVFLDNRTSLSAVQMAVAQNLLAQQAGKIMVPATSGVVAPSGQAGPSQPTVGRNPPRGGASGAVGGPRSGNNNNNNISNNTNGNVGVVVTNVNRTSSAEGNVRGGPQNNMTDHSASAMALRPRPRVGGAVGPPPLSRRTSLPR